MGERRVDKLQWIDRNEEMLVTLTENIIFKEDLKNKGQLDRTFLSEENEY